MTEAEKREKIKLDRLDAIKKAAASAGLEAKKSYFLEAYFLNACTISAACAVIGISRQTFYNWEKEDPKFAALIKDQEEDLIDLAESQLYNNIMAGKETSLIFLLCNRRPDRWKNIQRIDMRMGSETRGFIDGLNKILSTPEADELKLFSEDQLKAELAKRKG